MTILLVRHASAGDRAEWDGEDRLRPLDARGRRQAEALVGQLAGFEIDRILSSPYVRCVQTVEPLARTRGLEIKEREELAEEHQETAGPRLVRALGSENAVVCGHGGLSEAVVGRSQKKGETLVLDLRPDAELRVSDVLGTPG
jgi:phosphohistidine phosphatase SixA